MAFVGDAARGARKLARALSRLGYATAEARTVSEIGVERIPLAVVVSSGDGVDPYRAVRAVRTRPHLTDSLVFAWTPSRLEQPVGVAVAAGADDVVGGRAPLEDSVDRIAGRLARGRALHYRVAFDCLTHIRGRLFVSERLSAEIGSAVQQHAVASFAVVWLSGFALARAQSGLFAAERDLEAASFALVTAVRPSDLPCRLSDDTFVVLLPRAGAREASFLMESARARMSARAPAMGDIAIGLTEAPRDGLNWQDLFARAEAGLRPMASCPSD